MIVPAAMAITGQKRKWQPSPQLRQLDRIRKKMNVQKLDAKLRKYRREDTEWTQYQVLAGSPSLTTKNVWHLTKTSTMVKRFGPDAGGVPYLHKIDYDFQFKCHSEEGPTTFTAFLVTLRTDTMSQLTENQGTDLQGGLLENIHYMNGLQQDNSGVNYTSGQVELNPAYFKILKRWNFAIGVETFSTAANEPSRSLDESYRRYTGMVKVNKKLQNGRGNFDPASMSTFQNEAKVFLLTFTDNVTSIEGAPVLDGQCMLTVRST